MRCTACGCNDDKVIDSRSVHEERAVRRRRECLRCGRRFTTYEYIEEVPLMVIKKDGRRQAFDRKKIQAGIVKACEKRPVSMDTVEEIVTEIERSLQKKPQREVSSAQIGELIMGRLKELDDVAYVRFASVYRQFRDVEQFLSELKVLIGREKRAKGKGKKGHRRA